MDAVLNLAFARLELEKAKERLFKVSRHAHTPLDDATCGDLQAVIESIEHDIELVDGALEELGAI